MTPRPARPAEIAAPTALPFATRAPRAAGRPVRVALAAPVTLAAASLAALAAAALAAFLPAPAFAQAEAFPAKPIRVVVPYPPGGTTDVLARAVGDKLAQAWGQPVVIDNKGGAAGNIGTEAAAQAAPDGYTLVVGNNATHATNVTLFPGVKWHPVKSFDAITLVATVPHLLVVPAGRPTRTVAELVAASRARPGGLTYASSSPGSASHLIAELFKQRAAIPGVHVPYKGVAQAVTDLLGGQVDYMFATLPSVLQHAQTGKLTPVAVASGERVPTLAAVPTMAEAGVAVEADAWFGFFAPAGTPPAILDRYHAEIVRIVGLPDVREKLAAAGFTIRTQPRAQFQKFVASEVDRWAEVIRVSGAKVE
jgi:tripartite-type tricarboxylate transporter receptor subunit TctC